MNEPLLGVSGIIVLVYNILSCNCQQHPTIVHISDDQMRDIGSTVEISCSVQYVQTYPVLWVKSDPERFGNNIHISHGTKPILRDSRFSLRYELSTNTYTVQIKDIQPSDAGTYKCQIVIGLNQILTKEVKLFVKGPPVIYDNSTIAVVQREGDLVTLECYAGGSPLPIIAWRRENHAILPTGGVVYRGNILTIPSIKKEDRGVYYCTASNGVGIDAERNIAVSVEFAPTISCSNKQIWQAVGYDADMDCRIEAYPEPTIIWIKDQIQLFTNSRYSVFTSISEFSDTSLRVKRVDRANYGMYICQAKNRWGQAEERINLYETSEPQCPPACGYGSGSGFISANEALVAILLTKFLWY